MQGGGGKCYWIDSKLKTPSHWKMIFTCYTFETLKTHVILVLYITYSIVTLENCSSFHKKWPGFLKFTIKG